MPSIAMHGKIETRGALINWCTSKLCRHVMQPWPVSNTMRISRYFEMKLSRSRHSLVKVPLQKHRFESTSNLTVESLGLRADEYCMSNNESVSQLVVGGRVVKKTATSLPELGGNVVHSCPVSAPPSARWTRISYTMKSCNLWWLQSQGWSNADGSFCLIQLTDHKDHPSNG